MSKKSPSRSSRNRFNTFITHLYKYFKVINSNFSVIYKVNILLALFISLFFTYYFILTKIKPFSVPYIKSIITEKISTRVSQKLTLDDIKFSFTNGGKVKMDLINLKSQQFNDLSDSYSLSIPNISLALPIYKLLIFDYTPSIIILKNASYSSDSISLNQNDKNNSKGSSNRNEKILALLKTISQIQIIDFNIKLKNNAKKDLKLFMPYSELNIEKNGDIKIRNKLKIKLIEREDQSFEINTYCNINKHNLNGQCDINMSEFNFNILSNIFSSPVIFDKIHSRSYIRANYLKSNNKKYIDISISSPHLELKLKEMLHKSLNIKNSIINLRYDFINDSLSSKNLKGLVINDQDKLSSQNTGAFSSTFTINGIKNFSSSDIDINLSNIKLSDIDQFWPKSIDVPKIRNWIKNHFKQGVVKSSSTKIALSRDNDSSKIILSSLESKSKIDNAILEYSKNFPPLSELDLEANFDKKSMKINIESGKVLNSNISKSSVSIDNFKNPTLKINANVDGNSKDLFLHINHKSKPLSQNLDTIFNNSLSQSIVDVNFPLNKKISFKDFYININSHISDIDNSVLSGNANFKLLKNNNSHLISSYLDLNDTITNNSNILNIKKKLNDEMNLQINLNLYSDIINSSLSSLKINNYNIIKSSFEFNNKSQLFNKFYINNTGFGNDYSLRYVFEKDSSKININGKKVILSKSSNTKRGKKDYDTNILKYFKFDNFNLVANINTISNDNMNTKNVKIALKCKKYICDEGILNSKYNKNKDLIDIKIVKNRRKSPKISGKIRNLGYFFELFNLSENFRNGEVSIDINQGFDKKENQVLYRGELKLSKNDITVYDNPTIKSLESDNLFAKIKDTIFSNNKTIFSRMKSKFIIAPKSGNIKIKSFIVNNYKIGITAKGSLNYKSGKMGFKGMIVPGYIINNLFGVTNIPVVGNIISEVLTGGKNEGLFGLSYNYNKQSYSVNPNFTTMPAKSLIPSSIKNILD